MPASRTSTATSTSAAITPNHGSRLLDAAVDGSLAGVLLFAPWFMGGRHPLGELVYVICAVAAALAWLARQAVSGQSFRWTWSGAEWLIAGGLTILLMQAVPLPAPIFRLLSAHSNEILTLWNGSDSPASLGTWTQVSMAPAATRAGLAVFLAHGLLLLVAVQRLRTVGDVQRLLSAIAVATVVMASLGLVQYLTSNGKFLWVYEHPHRHTLDAVKGPFINKNHFAHMLALGIGPLLWSLQRVMRRENCASKIGFVASRSQRTQPQLPINLHLLGLGLVLFAGLMTLSRGGIAVMGLATALCFAAYAKAGLLNAKLIGATLGIATVTGIALGIHGYQQVTERLDDYTAGSVDELDQSGGRRAIWSADALAVRDYPILGTGVGTHIFTYPMYLPKAWPTVMTHAESGYLQIALETGLAGLVVLLAAIVVVGRWCWRCLRSTNTETYACGVAVVSGLTASLIHSIWDFVWYLPACMSLTLLLMAAAYRLSRHAENDELIVRVAALRSPILAWGAAASIAVCGAWMASNRFCAAMAAGHWDEYVKFINRPDFKEGKLLANETIIEHLEQVVRWIPDEAAPHLRLANECLRRFEREQAQSENAIPLNQICEAAIASNFASPSDLNEWLSRAVGPAKRFLDRALWHTRQALNATPLQDDGYIFMADLHFLQGTGNPTVGDYIDQALRVRPYSARVLMAAGKQAALSGDFRRAIEYWRRSLSTDLQEQRQLVDILVAFSMAAQEQGRHAGQSEGSAVEFILREFQPGLPLSRLLLHNLAPLAAPEDVDLLRAHLVRVGQATAAELDEKAAAEIWIEMSYVYHDMKQDEKAVALLRRAIAVRPNDYAAMLALGIRLLDLEQYDEARQHLEWCRMRKPNEASLGEVLARAVKQQIERQTRGPSLPARTIR